MDLTLTPDQELIASTAREFLAARSAKADARAVEAVPEGYSTGLWSELVDLGWPGLAIPERHGGVGEGFLELCLVVEELGRAGVPTPLLPTAVCAAVPIARFGTDEQRERWLGDIAGGRVLSYATGGTVRATATDDALVLDGTARFVPFAHVAQELLVVAESDAGPVAALVDAAALRCTPLDVVGPGRRHHVEFQAVEVPAERMLPDGPAAAASLVAHGTAATCAEMVGGAQRVLDMTVAYAREREQFGRPIGSFQAVQHHCADMAIDVLGSRFIAYEAIWRLGAGQDPVGEVALTVSMAKAWVSEAYQRVCALGQQVHGAIGFTREHDLHLFTRHAMASALDFGDGDQHWDRIAAHLQIAP